VIACRITVTSLAASLSPAASWNASETRIRPRTTPKW
jgi:hypothetical protein